MRIGLLIAASLSAMAVAGRPVAAVRSEEPTIGVPGRSSQTPWAASVGEFVVVAFGGETALGKADVFVAVNRDGGGAFPNRSG